MTDQRQLTALQQTTLWELSQALGRERLPEQRISEQDRPYDVRHWLRQAVEHDGLGNNPYVQELYQERFGVPVPQEYRK